MQLLIKRRRASVLPAGRVVPQIPPLRVLTKDLSRRLTLDEVEVIELGERFHGVIHFGSGLARVGQSHALVFEHVFVPGAPPGACRHKSAHGMRRRDQRSETASVAEADHDGAVRVQKCVLAHGPERRLVAFELGCEVGLVAGCSLAFADSGFFCPHRGITGLVDQTQHERAKAIGFALGRFDAVATQPAHKEQHRHLAASVPRMGDERAELIATGVGYPVVNDVGVLKMFPGTRLLRVGRRGDQQRKAGKDSRGSGRHGQTPCHRSAIGFRRQRSRDVSRLVPGHRGRFGWSVGSLRSERRLGLDASPPHGAAANGFLDRAEQHHVH